MCWICDQQRNFKGAKANDVAAGNVRILIDDLTTDAGDFFLLRDNLGVPRKNRFIRFAAHTNLNLLLGATNWFADDTFSVSLMTLANPFVIHSGVVYQTLTIAFLIK